MSPIIESTKRRSRYANVKIPVSQVRCFGITGSPLPASVFRFGISSPLFLPPHAKAECYGVKTDNRRASQAHQMMSARTITFRTSLELAHHRRDGVHYFATPAGALFFAFGAAFPLRGVFALPGSALFSAFLPAAFSRSRKSLASRFS